MTRIKILFLAANPSGTTKLALDEEARSIAEKVRLAEHRDSIELIPGLAARPDDLLQLLNLHKPHIVHFSGHGASAGIFLVGARGGPKLVATKTLRELFRTLRDNIQVVFLNACYSDAQAQAITTHIDVCIGMSDSVDDKSAIAFAASFYRALAFGRPVKQAFEQGQLAIKLAKLPRSDVPRLVTKTGIDAANVVLVLGAQGSIPQAPAGPPRPVSVSDSDASTPPQRRKRLPRAAPPTPARPESIRDAGADGNDTKSVSPSALRLFRLCWQLETWMRTLVYVEFRAAHEEWYSPLSALAPHASVDPVHTTSATHKAQKGAHAAFSRFTFDQFSQIITAAEHWPHFIPYFPQREHTILKFEEARAIRNRVTRFRQPLPQDESRLELFLRDLEPGLRRFCSRYSKRKIPLDPADDPVTERLSRKWHRLGYGIELSRPDFGWLYAPEPHRASPLFNASLELCTHDNYERGSAAGVIYRLGLHPMRRGRLNLQELLESTRDLHEDVIHIIPSPISDTATITVPAIIGLERTVEVLAAFLNAGRESSRHQHVRAVVNPSNCSDYIVWPNDPIAFFLEGYSEDVFDYT
ncbi:CHAT domain-containing protein [Sorangium sp. So ce375]|uniref:CHAT domain-containing protein n=1 Tax=Sorangium sp. So ce375 TaxID=3133306 RepID=UPI003F5C0882